MRVVIQRTQKASVEVNQQVISTIDQGLLILLGVEEVDTLDDAQWLAGKIAKMRIFDDGTGKMNQSVTDISGEILVVSQFTLHASTKKGNRPSFIRSAWPEVACQLYERFCDLLSLEIHQEVKKGVFGAMMKVQLINDGPVTITMDSRQRE
jgi:D-tyrosyl-tRNA(Tyr) deacylase